MLSLLSVERPFLLQNVIRHVTKRSGVFSGFGVPGINQCAAGGLIAFECRLISKLVFAI
jgi:hypothetical protein